MVTIRPFDQKNLALHYKWYNEQECDYFISGQWGKAKSFKAFIQQVKSVLDDKNRSANIFEIHLTDSNKLIGVVHIHSIDLENKSCCVNCEVGHRDYNTTQYKIDALRQTLGYCFEELEMQKVMTTAFDYANGWEKQVQKLGFTKEVKPSASKNGKPDLNNPVYKLKADQYGKGNKSSGLKAVN
ncbi:MAG: GNAT family protein [Balneolaceae bacterium]|nr:GNAT family protein [Balneolaceae bacterium]